MAKSIEVKLHDKCTEDKITNTIHIGRTKEDRHVLGKTSENFIPPIVKAQIKTT